MKAITRTVGLEELRGLIDAPRSAYLAYVIDGAAGSPARDEPARPRTLGVYRVGKGVEGIG